MRILSDLHLGHSASRIGSVEALRPLVAGAGTLVFNGDTWQELARGYRERSRALLEELRELCREEEVEAVFLSGNHDPGWPGPGWVELAGGRVLVTHGDAILWSGSPWSREAFARVGAVRELWAAHEAAGEDPAVRLKLAREIAVTLRAAWYPRGRGFFARLIDAVRPPRRAWEILRVWGCQAGEATRFAERYFPQAEVVVIGHFHHPGVWRRCGRTVINTGAFVRPHGARWVEWHDGELRYGKVAERDGHLVPAAGKTVWTARASGTLADSSPEA